MSRLVLEAILQPIFVTAHSTGLMSSAEDRLDRQTGRQHLSAAAARRTLSVPKFWNLALSRWRLIKSPVRFKPGFPPAQSPEAFQAFPSAESTSWPRFICAASSYPEGLDHVSGQTKDLFGIGDQRSRDGYRLFAEAVSLALGYFLDQALHRDM